ncbi:MAG: Crp/Fnr family transcriptional regulator [Anaerovoracaceae bacterium]|jgi:CRP-like cAMP-binding protein
MDKEKFLQQALNIQDEELLTKFAAASKVIHFKKDSLLIKAGDSQEYADILVSGILRGFFIDFQGKDITDSFFYQRGDIVMGCHGFNNPALISIEALTEGDVVRIPVPDISRLLDEYHELSIIYSKILMRALDKQWKIKNAVYQYSAIDRYKWFIRSYPELLHTVPNKYIASFLNITPVTLSRIKAKLKASSEQIQKPLM